MLLQTARAWTADKQGTESTPFTLQHVISEFNSSSQLLAVLFPDEESSFFTRK